MTTTRPWRISTNRSELNPNADAPYNNRSIIYLGRKEYDSAIADFDKAIELKATQPLLFKGRSFGLLEEARYWEHAAADSQKALSLNPPRQAQEGNGGRISRTSKLRRRSRTSSMRRSPSRQRGAQDTRSTAMLLMDTGEGKEPAPSTKVLEIDAQRRCLPTLTSKPAPRGTSKFRTATAPSPRASSRGKGSQPCIMREAKRGISSTISTEPWTTTPRHLRPRAHSPRATATAAWFTWTGRTTTAPSPISTTRSRSTGTRTTILLTIAAWPIGARATPSRPPSRLQEGAVAPSIGQGEGPEQSKNPFKDIEGGREDTRPGSEPTQKQGSAMNAQLPTSAAWAAIATDGTGRWACGRPAFAGCGEERRPERAAGAVAKFSTPGKPAASPTPRVERAVTGTFGTLAPTKALYKATL